MDTHFIVIAEFFQFKTPTACNVTLIVILNVCGFKCFLWQAVLLLSSSPVPRWRMSGKSNEPWCDMDGFFLSSIWRKHGTSADHRPKIPKNCVLFSNLILILLMFYFLTKRNKCHNVTRNKRKYSDLVNISRKGGWNPLEKSRTPLKRKIVHLFPFFFMILSISYNNHALFSSKPWLNVLLQPHSGYSASTVSRRGRGVGDVGNLNRIWCSGRANHKRVLWR